MTTERLVQIASVLSDVTRAGILTALMDGRAYTVTELSNHVGVAVSTTSEHLSRLRRTGLVAVESAGRHRYYRLAGPETASLLESLGAHPDAPGPSRRIPTGLAFARTCYDHLAGSVAVRIYAHCVWAGHLTEGDGSGMVITAEGERFFSGLGLDLQRNPSRRERARRCLDWTERRPHLGGLLGAQLLTEFFDRRWLARGSRPRAVRLTRAGQQHLARYFAAPA